MKIRKPNFFVVGSKKCGTTALYNYLKLHPDIFMPERKEFHFFGEDLDVKKLWWNNNKNDYLNFFKKAKNQKMIGEASPHYMLSKTAAKEIKEFSPKAKIIIILRNPIDQIYSNYRSLFYFGVEKNTNFEHALFDKKRRINNKSLDPFSKSLLRYIDIARYYNQVNRFIKVFGKRNVHVIIFDDFAQNTPETYKKILKFLGVDSNFSLNFNTINSIKTKNVGKNISYPIIHKFFKIIEERRDTINNSFLPRRFSIGDKLFNILKKIDVSSNSLKGPPNKAKKTIIKLLYSDIRKLENLIGRDLSMWYEAYI